MLAVERSIHIQRPVEEVFAFLTKFENQSKWQSSTDTRQTSPGPVGVGTTFTHTGKFLGMKILTSGEVYEFEPNRAFSYRADGSATVDMHYRFEPAAGGTRFTLSYGGALPGLLGLARPLLVRITDRMLDADLLRAKRLLEVETGTVGTAP